MGRLAQTEGLTDVQQEIVKTVRGFVDKEILPNVATARARRRVPERHRRGHEGDGAVRPDDPRGVRRARRVAADLRPGGGGDRPRLDERQRHHQHPLHRGVPAQAARHRRAERGAAAEDGHRRGARVVLDVRAGAAARTSARSRPRRCATATTTCITGQKMWITNGGTSNLLAVLVRTDERRRTTRSRTSDDDVPGREGAGLRRGRARAHHPGEDREDGLQGRRLDRGGLRRAAGAGDPGPRRRDRQGLLPDDGRRRGGPRQRRRPRLRGRAARVRARRPRTPSSARRSASRSPSTRPCSSGSPRWRRRSRPRTR